MPLYEPCAPSEGIYKDKGSKFYAFALPVRSREEAENALNEIRKKYHDARHHCYAYRIGKEGELSFANDDGEPAHSAGTPILGQIKSLEMTNVMVVVVRYFGGILLGVRGLIDAYKGAAFEALSQAEKTEVVAYMCFSLQFSYERTSEINRLLHPFPVKMLESTYLEDCRLTYQIRKSEMEQVRKVFGDLYGCVYAEWEMEG